VEIGAGGGSIIWIDEIGSLKVGPISAGADPGPACYGRGGDKPTLTDAFVISGVIDPDYFLGGDIRLRSDLAEKALAPVASRLGLSLKEAATGAIRIADSNMVNMIKLVSVQRGYDPRDFAIVAFGGGGPMFAADLARDLGVETIIVPPVPGVFSAWGMLLTDVRHDFVQTKVMSFKASLKEVNSIFGRLHKRGVEALKKEGVKEGDEYFRPSLDLRYLGQEHAVNTPVDRLPLVEADLQSLVERFGRLHKKAYTFAMSDPLEVVNVRLTAFGRVKKPSIKPMSDEGKSLKKALRGEREVVLLSGKARAKVYERSLLPKEARIAGPAIIAEKTTTTLLGSGDVLKVSKFGYLIIKVKKGAV
jgi:N-methylhydantoinase A